MAIKDIDIDDTLFLQRTKALARKLGEGQKDFIQNQTGILAREVARMTPPFATFPKLSGTASVGTAKDIAMGKQAITDDLYNICSIRELKTVKWARKAFGTGPVYFESQAAGGTIINEAELHAWHKRNLRPSNTTRKLPNISKFWVTQTIFNRYAKNQHQYVGRAKATFYKVALKLGAKVTAPANVKNNALLVSSSGVVNTKGGFAEGVIKGRAGGLFHTIGWLPMLRNNRLIKAVKRGEYIMKQAAKDSGFDTV